MKKSPLNYDSLSKFWYAPLSDFSPEKLRDLKTTIESGDYTLRNRLFAAMYAECDVLQEAVNEMAQKAANLQYIAHPYTIEGQEPTPEAVAVANLVNRAVWQMSDIEQGTWSQTFTQFLETLYHALCRGVTVHEISWKLSPDLSMWYPAAYQPVLPQFYGWSLSPGERDRLLLFKNADRQDGKPFSDFPHRFIVALNTTGPDHPLRNALFISLVGWFGAYKYGLVWLSDYCQTYGKPSRVFKVRTPEERETLRQQLEENPVLTDVIIDIDDEFEIASGSTGTSIPQSDLMRLAEKAMVKLIKHQTLTTDTSDGGSRAQAQVHADVLDDSVKSIGAFICQILNSQLVPAIVAKNFPAGVPMPEFRASSPNAKVDMQAANMLDVAINQLGMRVKLTEAYERLGLSIPGGNDEVLERMQQAQSGMDEISAAARESYGNDWRTMQKRETLAESLTDKALKNG